MPASLEDLEGAEVGDAARAAAAERERDLRRRRRSWLASDSTRTRACLPVDDALLLGERLHADAPQHVRKALDPAPRSGAISERP